MYKAKNGFILRDNTTPGGWKTERAEDILTALLIYPAFETVADCFIWEAIDQAVQERKEYADISEFAAFLAENYL